MKRFFIATGLFAAFLLGDWQAAIESSPTGGSFVRPAAAYNDDAYRDFDQALRPYGQWVVTPQWGHVWIPAGVPRGWRPYSDGHWDYADDYGWVWVSDQEWGWAPFHYGRWAFDGRFGWVWVPGRVWGPAWVSFRYGDASIGWAPLPPDGYDDVPYYGYEPTINVSWWNFVPRQHFNDRHVNRYYDYHNNENNFHRTKNVTNITVVNNRVVNNSINVNQFENETHQRVVRRRVDVTDRVVPGNQRTHGNDIVVVRPKDVERNAGTPRMRGAPSQQTGSQNGGNQGNQNGNRGNGNQPGAGPAIVTDRDHGKPNGQNQNGPSQNGQNPQAPAQAVILPPAGKPDKHRGNDNRNDNRGGPVVETNAGQGKPNGNQPGPAQTQLPPPTGKPDKPRGAGGGPAYGQDGTAQNLNRNDNPNRNGNANGGGHGKPVPAIIPPPDNGNRYNQSQQHGNDGNNGHGQAGNNGRNRQQQQQQEAEQTLRQNNGQGRPQQQPPAHAPKKAPDNDCQQNGNKGCNKS